jgi:purine nucleosidase
VTEPIPVVIDTDVGADPDDALALALAMASPEIEVLGVTVVSGDVDLRARIAARLLGMAGRADIPVFRGRRPPVEPGGSPEMLGTEGQGVLDHPYDGPEATIQETPAPEWLVQQAGLRPYHLVAIGPLSNVATALELDPRLAARLLGLTAMGGVFDVPALSEGWRRAIAEGGPAAWPDYNTASDPAAAVVCAHSGVALTWVTVETTFRVPLRRPALDRLDAGQPLFLALRRAIESWSANSLTTSLPAGELGTAVPEDAVCFLHDPLTVAALFPGDWLTLARTGLAYRIEDGLFRMEADANGVEAAVSVGVDGPAFAAYFVERIAGLVAGEGG